MADLIQIAASMELRDLNGPHDLLIRESMDPLTKRQIVEYERAEGTEAANKLRAEMQNYKWMPPPDGGRMR